MIALVDLIDEHPDAVAYDLISHGLRLRDFPDGGVTWGDLRVIVSQAPPTSAVHRALNPAWEHSNTLELLRQAVHGLNVLAWMQSRDGAKGRNYPTPPEFPWEWSEGDGWRGDAMTLDEAADWLGWTAEMQGRAPLAQHDD